MIKRKVFLIFLFALLFTLPNIYATDISLYKPSFEKPVFTSLSFNNSFIKPSYFLDNYKSELQKLNTSKKVSLPPVTEAVKENVFLEDPYLLDLLSKPFLSFGGIDYPPGVTIEDIKKKSSLQKNRSTSSASSVPNTNGTAPTTGTYHIPVLLVDFNNYSHTLDRNVFEEQFNDSNYYDGNATSVRSYYLKQSYGALDIIYDVYDWRTLSNTYAYYAIPTNKFIFVNDTINLFGTGSNAIDFTQYDSDNDGRLDGVVILHAGYSRQDAGAGYIKSSTLIFNDFNIVTIQGKYYGNTATISEKIPQNMCDNYFNSGWYPPDCRVGVLVTVHEFAHILGLPDLYAINPYTGLQEGMGLVDITMMIDTGFRLYKPINLDAWSRYFLGWITPTTITANMSGVYAVHSIDTNSSGAFILKDETKMGDREFFIIENRFMSTAPDNQDTWLFGGNVPGQTENVFGGIAIYHIDEQYIEDNYPTNSIMWEEDGLMYDDNVSHPGIVFEQNILDQNPHIVLSSQHVHISDLYTNEYNEIFGYPDWGTFDSTKRLYEPYFLWDTTSLTYNGLQNTGVVVSALSGSGSIVYAYLQSQTPPFTAFISSPKNNKWYKLTNTINFNASYSNPSGDVSCVWKKEGNIIISQECSFIKTPLEIGLESTGCAPNNTPIYLEITDNDTIIERQVNIRIYESVRDVCEQAHSNQNAAIE